MAQKVIIASKNPVKIAAVKEAFSSVFSSEFLFEGQSVDSGVSDQPLSDRETLQGSYNRAARAKEHFPDATYWVGLEGGIEKKENEMMSFAWITILSKTRSGKGRTATFLLPKKIVELINRGIELGEANDIVFKKTNSKQKNGAIGLLTHDQIDRKKLYYDGVILALIPFQNPEIYPKNYLTN